MDIEAIYFFTYTHTRATGMLTSCTYMYLIKGFGFILIVNCLLHPLLIFLVHYASAVISSAPPPRFDINFNNDTRIRISA